VVGDETGGAGEVERDHGEHEPGAVRGEHPGRQMRERAALQIGVDLFDDRVTTVGLVRRDGVRYVLRSGGEDRVMPVGVEQRRLLHLVRVQVRDAPDHEPALDSICLLPRAERGERHVGDLGFGDPPPGLVADRVRYSIVSQASSPMVAIAAFAAGSIRTVTDTSAPALIAVPTVACP
jgi:hypothetical protein